MKINKKILGLVLASMLSVSMVGCGGSDNSNLQNKENFCEEKALTIDEQYKLANEIIVDYMKNENVNYTIEEDKDLNLITVKLPVRDIDFKLSVVTEEGFANEMLDYISTHSKNCMELIVEYGCNDIGVQFAIVSENDTNEAYLSTINGVTVLNVIKEYTEVEIEEREF